MNFTPSIKHFEIPCVWMVLMRHMVCWFSTVPFEIIIKWEEADILTLKYSKEQWKDGEKTITILLFSWITLMKGFKSRSC